MPRKRLSIVIFEDEYESFNMICDSIVSETADIFPKSQDLKTFYELKLLYTTFLKNHVHSYDNSDVVERIKRILPQQVDLFIIDYGLLDRKKEVDDTGGIIRKEFISKQYPNVHTLYISIYSKNTIVENGHLFEATDFYISKRLLKNSIGVSVNPLTVFLDNFQQLNKNSVE